MKQSKQSLHGINRINWNKAVFRVNAWKISIIEEVTLLFR